MELEFDKEMDSLLRKADRGVLVGDKPGDKPKVHLDADELAAFVENAMPERTRALHMAHLADCDRCRRILSGLIALNADDVAVESHVAAPATAAAAEPWYRKFFLFPNLAYVMGGLVLVFGGLLTFSVLQTAERESSVVSQAIDGESGRGPMEPMSALDQAPAANSTNSAAAVSNSNASMAQNAASNTSANSMSNSAIIGSALAPRGEAEVVKPVQDKGFSLDGADASTAGVKTVPAPAPAAVSPPPPKDADIASGDTVAEAAKEETKLLEKKRVANEKDDGSLSARQVQELPRTQAGGKAKAQPGPSRDAQNFPNRANNTFELPTMKRSAGKNFEFRNGAWYDISYRGQATKNVRRGTDEYRDLDIGLRSIAESMSGVVVVVWEGKAYRIQ